jgi:hypothetical protein
MTQEPNDNEPSVHVYGALIDPQHINSVISYIHAEMHDLCKSQNPITYASQTILMAPDLTMQVWGTPMVTFVQIIEMTNLNMRSLN